MCIENYEKFLNSVSEDIEKIFDYQKEYLYCKKGCSYCCKRGDYPMSEIEHKYLMIGFEKLDNDIKEKIKNNIKKAKNGDIDSYICPFLIEESCSIYEYRPIVCRTFGVLTEDAKGNPAFPFCSTIGLNYSKIYDKEKKQLSTNLVHQNNFHTFPKFFKLSNNVVMNIPLAKNLNIEFGKSKRMIDFFE